MTIGFEGDPPIGAKTNLLWALVNEKPSKNFKNKNGDDLNSTIGFDHYSKKINIIVQTINISFIDFCGQKFFFDVNLVYLRNVNIIVLGYLIPTFSHIS